MQRRLGQLSCWEFKKKKKFHCGTCPGLGVIKYLEMRAIPPGFVRLDTNTKHGAEAQVFGSDGNERSADPNKYNVFRGFYCLFVQSSPDWNNKRPRLSCFTATMNIYVLEGGIS